MDFTALNAFDYIVIAIIGFSTLFAFFRGFIQTVMSFIAWFGSIFIAVYLFPHIQPMVAGHIDNPIVANTVAFLGTYFVLVIAFVILGFQLVYIAGALRFGPIDKALGFAFGVVRGVVLVTVMFMVIMLFISLFGAKEQAPDGQPSTSPEIPSWLADAQTYDLLRKSSATALHMVPDKVWDKIRGYAKSFDAPKRYASWHPTSEIGNVVKDMTDALPEDSRKDIFKKYGLPVSGPDEGTLKGASSVPLTNFDFSKDVFRAYQDAMAEGKAQGIKLSPEALQGFEKIFNQIQPAVDNMLKNKDSIEKSAYNNNQAKQLDKQVKELDRLLRE